MNAVGNLSEFSRLALVRIWAAQLSGVHLKIDGRSVTPLRRRGLICTVGDPKRHSIRGQARDYRLTDLGQQLCEASTELTGMVKAQLRREYNRAMAEAEKAHSLELDMRTRANRLHVALLCDIDLEVDG